MNNKDLGTYKYDNAITHYLLAITVTESKDFGSILGVIMNTFHFHIASFNLFVWSVTKDLDYGTFH
jgi:hypothetical protein